MLTREVQRLVGELPWVTAATCPSWAPSSRDDSLNRTQGAAGRLNAYEGSRASLEAWTGVRNDIDWSVADPRH